MAKFQKEKCCAQAGRARADNGHTLTGGWRTRRSVARAGEIGDFAFNELNRDRSVILPAPATLFARCPANPAEHAGENDVLFHERDGFVQLAGRDKADCFRDLQVRRAGALADRDAIAEMITEQKFQRCFARRFHFDCFAGDDHACGNARRAGWHESRIIADFHNASHTRWPIFFHAGQKAERRNFDAELPGGVENRAAIGHGDRFVVDCQGGAHW